MTVDDNQPGSKPPVATPHPYIPPGPVQATPSAGFCQPEARQQAFAAVLQGIEIGAYDIRMMNWLTGWDDPTCRTIASLMHRCRLAGAAHLATRLEGLRRLLAAILADEQRSRQLALEYAEAKLADICATAPDQGSVMLTAAGAAIVRQALADASVGRTEGDRCGRRAGRLV